MIAITSNIKSYCVQGQNHQKRNPKLTHAKSKTRIFMQGRFSKILLELTEKAYGERVEFNY